IDNSPKATPGMKYQVVILRADTAETVTTPVSLLLEGVDDTAPVQLTAKDGLQTMGMIEPLRLTFNEPVTASRITGMQQFLVYSTTPDQDISSRFVLDVVSEKSIRLRLKDGQSLENNAAYQITVNGITDVAGNIATGSSLAAGGKYTYSLTAPDTLAPRTLNI